MAFSVKNTLFVRNLSPQVNEAVLREIFGEHDVVEQVKFRAFPNTNNQFFAQIDFATSKGVAEGSKLSGTPIMGVACIVGVMDPAEQQAKEQQARAEERMTGLENMDVASEFLKKTQEEINERRARTVHISNLPDEATTANLRVLCGRFGEIEGMRVDRDEAGAFGLVEFKERGPAHMCKMQQRFSVDGRVLVFTEARTLVDASTSAEKTVHFENVMYDADNIRVMSNAQPGLLEKLEKVKAAAREIAKEPEPEPIEYEPKRKRGKRGDRSRSRDSSPSVGKRRRRSSSRRGRSGSRTKAKTKRGRPREEEQEDSDATEQRGNKAKKDKVGKKKTNKEEKKKKKEEKKKKKQDKKQKKAKGKAAPAENAAARGTSASADNGDKEAKDGEEDGESGLISVDDEVDVVPNTELLVLGAGSSSSSTSSTSSDVSSVSPERDFVEIGGIIDEAPARDFVEIGGIIDEAPCTVVDDACDVVDADEEPCVLVDDEDDRRKRRKRGVAGLRRAVSQPSLVLV